MFWLGLIIGWMSAAPLVILMLAMMFSAADADERARRLHDEK